ncbi:MAG: YigZ family protein [Clostridia bacterium]
MTSFRYVDGEYTFETEIKHSRFIATVCGEVDESEALKFLASTRKKYSDATHNCYAYIADMFGNTARFSDDGEPSGTAGQPMLEVLKRQGLAKTAVVVTRYFGGIKLGAGGLVGAYTGAVVGALNSVKIAEKTECRQIEISTDYQKFSQIEGFIRKETYVETVDYGDTVTATIYVALDKVNSVVEELKARTSGEVGVLQKATEYKKLV